MWLDKGGIKNLLRKFQLESYNKRCLLSSFDILILDQGYATIFLLILTSA